MGLRLHEKLWANFAVFGVIALALLFGLYLVFETIESEREQRRQVANTNQVLQDLREVFRATLNAETGQRGYLITLDRRYLEPYDEGRLGIHSAIARLREDVGTEPTARQSELLDEIENLVEVKFAEIDETVELLALGRLLDARRRVLTDEGQEAMIRLRAAIHEMEEIESEMLADSLDRTARAEARVLPLLGGVVMLLLVAVVLGYLLVTRTARAEAEAAQAAMLGEARDRADLLARELNHRVKNLFAVILAIVRMGGKEDPAAQPATERMAERIGALLTAHEVSQGSLDRPIASLETLVETTLRPYLSERKRAETSGPEVLIPAKRATPLGLVLHELTTNAVKYGCWKEEGLLEVTWRIDGESVTLDWREQCRLEGAEEAGSGFGTRLMEAAARQLRGTIERTIAADGVRVTISFPLED